TRGPAREVRHDPRAVPAGAGSRRGRRARLRERGADGTDGLGTTNDGRAGRLVRSLRPVVEPADGWAVECASARTLAAFINGDPSSARHGAHADAARTVSVGSGGSRSAGG